MSASVRLRTFVVLALVAALGLGLFAAPAAAFTTRSGPDAAPAAPRRPFAGGGVTATAVGDVPGTTLTLPNSVVDSLDETTHFDDVYAVQLYAGETLVVEVTPPAGAEWTVYLYAPGTTTINSGSWLASSWLGNDGVTETVLLTARETGVYYVDVYAGVGSGSYTLNAEVLHQEDDEDIPGVARSLPFVENSTLVYLYYPRRVYAVQLQAGQLLSAALTGEAGTDFDLLLWNNIPSVWFAGVAPVAGSQNHGTSTEALTYLAPVSGTYYLDVPSQWDSASGSFSLSAQLLQVPTVITINQSTTAVRGLKAFVLSGVLTPGSVGDPCVVMVKKPNSPRWSYSSARLCYSAAAAGGANWWYRYTPKLKGVYRFYVKYDGNASRLPSRSREVQVRIK
jgi:hypothetical protein